MSGSSVYEWNRLAGVRLTQTMCHSSANLKQLLRFAIIGHDLDLVYYMMGYLMSMNCTLHRLLILFSAVM